MGDYFPKPGGVFEGRYRIGSVIGRGGFAQIYLAEQIDLGRQVALKVLSPGLRGDDEHAQEVAERFRREAKLVASLRDPHTITMHDYGRTDDGLLYMVFEYVDGFTLSGLVRQEGRISARRAVKILRQCLLSLQEAHAMGVLHRDIKPANIMVYEHIGRTDQVKVLDFGIAKSILGDDKNTANDLTQTGMIIGTPRYMAPEQLRGTPLGPQTDLYSLGLVAFELLAGHKAIELDSLVSIITRQVSGEPIQLPENLGLSPRVRAIVNGLLHKSEQERFQNAGEVLSALDALSESDLGTADAGTYRRDSSAGPAPPAIPTAPDVPQDTPTSAMHAHAHPARAPSDFDAPTDESHPFSDGFSTSGSIPTLKTSRSRSRTPLILIALVLVLGGAGLFYLYTAPMNSSADTASVAPTDDVAPVASTVDDTPVDDTPENAAGLAQREAAGVVELGAALSASEQAQPAAARQQDNEQEKATIETSDEEQPERPATRTATPARDAQPEAETKLKRLKEAKKKASEPAPKKDDPSTSSFPALDGI